MSTIKSSTEYLTLNADGSGKDIKFQANGVEKASISSTGAFTSTSIDATKLSGDLPAIDGSALTGVGKVLQIVNVQDGALATGTTQTTNDDTVPQITEGTEFMTLAITPLSATSKLRIEAVNANGATLAAGQWMIMALFVGTTTNALASVQTHTGVVNSMVNQVLVHTMTSGVTTELTFRIRCGGNGADTYTFNGFNGGRVFGGTLASSITITEYEV